MAYRLAMRPFASSHPCVRVLRAPVRVLHVHTCERESTARVPCAGDCVVMPSVRPSAKARLELVLVHD